MTGNDQQDLLRRVNHPGRYTGGEWNISRKPFENAIRFCLIFPDLYELGASNLSLRILYPILCSLPEVFADRCFMPDLDLCLLLTAEKKPLFALGSQKPLAEFDFLGFTLQHELTYSNIIHILNLSGIPPLRKDRGDKFPLIIGGGPSTVNPEPLADIFDLFFIGEAEQFLPEMIELYKNCREKAAFLQKAGNLDGVYLPGRYNFEFQGPLICKVSSETGAKRVLITDLDKAPLNLRDLVPYVSIVHDRAILEIQRGCDFGCRFCLAGYIYRPRRERDPATLISAAKEMLQATGWEELSLSSLSSFCHSRITEIVDALVPVLSSLQITLSLPSLRINSQSLPLFKKISRLKKTGITLVPETGSALLRRFINKKVSDEELFSTAQLLINEGWQTIKLYFMLGFSPETDEDVLATAEFCRKILEMGVRKHGNRFKLNVAVSHFVPKPHTPFQWEAFANLDSLRAKISLLSSRLHHKCIKLSYHDFESSWLEAILSRGDRRLSQVIIAAALAGARLDSWGDHFRSDIWREAFDKCGVDPAWYLRERNLDEILPWEKVETGVTREFLLSERNLAYQFQESPSCGEKCSQCGVCP
ncbi:MAG: TIGR03960 family B12-binding radical SAM protein [Candidatus Wallbacteria bacterium]|nr:TIGR03960 family B12-binding radical SAM protein [Candidatus Wallbacteria bacterium]